MCKEFGVLPKAGGLYDQDPDDILLLKAGLYGLQKKAEYDSRQK